MATGVWSDDGGRRVVCAERHARRGATVVLMAGDRAKISPSSPAVARRPELHRLHRLHSPQGNGPGTLTFLSSTGCCRDPACPAHPEASLRKSLLPTETLPISYANKMGR